MRLDHALFMSIMLCSSAGIAASADSTPEQPRCAVSKGVQRNDVLQAGVPPDGRIVFRPGGAGFVDRDGALGIKFHWDRLVAGALIVGGRRLDAAAPPARAYMNDGYGNVGFQPAYVVFPSPGCWEITGRIGERSLTFVVQVEKHGDGPGWRYEGLSRGGFWYQTTLESGRTSPSAG